jgi:hypothetical protein
LHRRHSGDGFGHRRDLEDGSGRNWSTTAIADAKRAAVERLAAGGGHSNHGRNFAPGDAGAQDFVDGGIGNKAASLGGCGECEPQELSTLHGLKIAWSRSKIR